ncbi:MAG: hypothetical protein J0I08_23470 [Rhizobiales bacterium]|nr:hypothetical protein [Hyphomicrobiales bacterium]
MSDTEIIERSESLPAELTEAVDASLAVGLSRAEIDTQIATARRYPRQISRVAQSILSLATLDEETAEESMYALPRGGKPIQGPSIRFAEIVKTSYGNCRAAARVVHVDRVEKVVIAEGVFHDLETNTATRAEVRRRICDKYGKLYKDDMIIVTGNAACSIALRNAILGGVPKALWRKAYDAVQHTIAGDVKTLAETRDRAIKALANFGVTPEQVFAALGVSGVEDITIQHVPTLRGMFATLKNGEATVEEMFSGTLPRAGNHAVVRNPLIDDNTEVQREAGVNAPANAPSDDESRASDQGPLSNGSGVAQDRCESATPTNSNSSQASSVATDTPASDPLAPNPADAGNHSESSDGSPAADDGVQAGVDDKPGVGLPSGWQGIYADAMTAISDKPKSLATRRKEALQVIKGDPSDDDRAEMAAIEDLVKRRNSGELSPDAFKAALREIVPEGVEI